MFTKKRRVAGGRRASTRRPGARMPSANRDWYRPSVFFLDGEAKQTQNGLMARSVEGHERRHVPLSDHQQRQTDHREHFGRGVCLSKMDEIEHKSVAYSNMHIGMAALLLRTRTAPGYTSLSTHRCIARILWSLLHCLWYASLWSRYGCIAIVCIAMWYVTFTHALASVL